uniref:Uncharacterized protein n=1 Tax=Oryza brachyantha TaxID=4533 RepID=J3M5D8_ORYBR
MHFCLYLCGLKCSRVEFWYDYAFLPLFCIKLCGLNIPDLLNFRCLFGMISYCLL